MRHRGTIFKIGLALLLGGLLVSRLFAHHQQMPNFSQYKTVVQRKTAFIKFIRPLAKKANRAVMQQRTTLFILYRQWGVSGVLPAFEQRQVVLIANQYGVKMTRFDTRKQWALLLSHVDVVPLSLLIAQAANESAWGVSRFAKEGNNLFGQWCYKAGCGMVPLRRSANKRNEVKVFSSPQASVRDYIHNLNTHYAYKYFRQIRQQMRDKKQSLSGDALAEGLVNYSQRKQAYVKMIQSMIAYNRLELA